ncbi:MAG: DUF503 domain-containing protein [Porticoccaceae bacterium]
MKLLCLTLDFRLPACRSLKEKRRRLNGLKDKFGSNPNIAVSESDFHDMHDHARWSFVIVGENSRIIDAQKEQVQEYANAIIDGFVTRCDAEYLL